MEESIFIDVVLPGSLIVIMIGLGMSLSVEDFRRVVRFPKAALVGLASQLLVLPAIGFGLAHLFQLPAAWAVGLMLIAACPGGPTSNLITFVSRGDTALSITLTAVSSAVTMVTIPLILALSIAHFGVEAGTIRSPVGAIVLQIVAITAIPVALGLSFRHFLPELATRLERIVRIASAMIFGLVLAAVIVDQRQALHDHFFALGGVAATLNLVTMAVGFAGARLARLDVRQSVTISIESGIQNGTLAIVIAMSILGAGEIAVPAGVYSILMFVSGGLLMWYFGTVRAPAELDARVDGSGAAIAPRG